MIWLLLLEVFEIMRAVFLTCAIYASLPLLLLLVCNIVGSGFPLFPLLIGIAIYLGNRGGNNQESQIEN